MIINDRLGICDELERQMQFLVDTYQCEWAEVVNDPEKRRLFQQFVNTDETEPTIEFVNEREQQRPADWPSDFVPIERLSQGTAQPTTGSGLNRRRHVGAGRQGVGLSQRRRATIKYGKTQIAVFNFASRGEWYASQNMCPHKREFVLSAA